MISKRNALNIVCGSLAISSQMLASAISGPPKQVKPQSAAVRQASDRPALTEDQARLLVKEIPSVNIGETLARWSFPEIELAKLRQWSALLAEQPDRTDFLPQWTELVAKFKARNASLQGADVAHLIQMLMSAAYEEAHKDLDSFRKRSQFYKEMQARISEKLADAGRLQVLIRSQRNDPSAGTLIRLPSYDRVLQKCEEQPGPNQRLECREVLIATTMELDDYLVTSAKQVQEAKENAQKAELEVQKREQKRLQILEALSETSRLMYDTTRKSAR
jgi:hypothetical protein